MATKADGWSSGIPEGDVETEDKTKVLDETDKETEGETKVEGESQETEDEPEDEITISIGGDAPPAEDDELAAPTWVKEVREVNRSLKNRVRELEDQLATKAPAEKQVELGAKPTLESCEYDETKFASDMEAWTERKAEVARVQATERDKANKVETEYKSQLANYATAKKALPVRDFDVAEDVVKDNLSIVQQGIILRGAKAPHLVVYALGKSPKKAKELASITDPIKFAFAVATLEKDLKVTKKAPAPEKKVTTGAGSLSGGGDKQLERLRAAAKITGNFNEVVAYKRQLKARGNK